MDNLIGSAINNIKSAASSLFGQAPISPVPQAQTMPQAQPNFIQQIGSGLGNYMQGVEQHIGNMPLTGIPGWNAPVKQIPQFLQSNQSFALPNVPQGVNDVFHVQTPIGDFQPVQLARNLANVPFSYAANTISDTAQNLGNTLTGNSPMQYSQLKSAPARLGYNIASAINPDEAKSLGTNSNAQNVIGNVAGTVEGPLSVYSGGKVLGIGADAADSAATQTFFGAVKNGALQGGALTGLYSTLDSLSNGRNQTLVNQLVNATKAGTVGTVLGAATGGALGGGGYAVGQVFNSVMKAIKATNPGISDRDAVVQSGAYMRNKLGQFAGIPSIEKAGGGILRAKGSYAINDYSAIDKHLGLDQINPEAGFIRIPGATDTEATSPSTQEQASPQTQDNQVPNPAQSPVPNEANAPIVAQSAPVLPKGNITEPVVQEQIPSEPIIPQGKNRGLVDTAQASTNVTNATKPLVEGTYTPKTNTQLMGEAKGLLEQGTNLDLKGVPNVDQKVAATVQEAVNQDQAGNHEAAANLINNLAKQGTELGRGVQAFSLINKLSPEAYSLSAAKLIQEYNRTARVKIPELTAEQQGFISDAVANIKALPEGSREQGMAIAKLTDTISKYIPSSLTDKALAIWRTGLLTGPQTLSKIAVSHGVMSAMEGIKNIPTAALDKAISLITGARSMSLTSGGYISGARKGILAGVDNLVHGYNDPLSGGQAADFKNKVNFGDSLFGKAAQAYVDTVGRIHGSLYKPFYGAAHMNSLYDQALTEAGNQGLKGALKDDFVTNFMKNPPTDALATAQRDAEMATFQQKTALGQMASSVQQKGGVLSKIVVPFTKIPSAILTDVLNYSPAGIVKSIGEAIQRGEFTQDSQRQLVQGLGRGITGTGILYLGSQLYNNGMLALDKPTTPKEAAQWDLEGKKPQSILINGQWKSLGALGPLGHALAIGGYFSKGMNDVNTPGLGNALTTTAAGVGKTTLDQSYLMGMSNLTSAIQNPAQNAKYEAQSLASSVIPTGLGTVARAIDPLQREVNTIPDALLNKIPVARQNLLPKTDVLGNQVQRSGGVLQNLVDPFQSSTDTSGQATNNPVTTELGRLTAAGQSPTPTKLTANQTINGVKQKLTPAQLDTLNQSMGPQIQQSLNTLITSPGYLGLTDEQKKNAIDSTITQVRTQIRGNINLSNPSASTTTPTDSGVTIGPDGKAVIIDPTTGRAKTLDLNRGTPGDTSPAGLKQQATADANAKTLIENSQAFNVKSMLTQQAAFQMIAAAGGNPQQAFFGAVAALPAPQQAQYVQSYLSNPQNGDLATRINTLASNNVLNTSTVTAMNKGGLIDANVASGLKQALQQYAINSGYAVGVGSGGYGSGGGKLPYGAQRIKNQIRTSITRQHLYKVKKAKAPKMSKFKVKPQKMSQISLTSAPQKKFKVKKVV